MKRIFAGNRYGRISAYLRSSLRQCVTREAVVLVLLAAAFCFLSTRYIGQGYRVDGRCMEPWVYGGERVWAEKWTLRRQPPRRGDIVIFDHSPVKHTLFMKRIVALGGETVEIRDGILYINDRALPEPYKRTHVRENYGPHTVAPGTYFVLGDNRDYSDDSRYWGDVDTRRVVARAMVRYWPLRPGVQPFHAGYPPLASTQQASLP